MTGVIALDLACVALATGAVLHAWLEGSITAPARGRLAAPPRPGASQVRLLLRRLLSCDFCLSYHVPYLLLALVAPSWALGGGWWLLKLPVYSLAATRVAVVVNWLLPRRARYRAFALEEELGDETAD